MGNFSLGDRKRETMFTFFDLLISNVSALGSMDFGDEMASMTRLEGDLSGGPREGNFSLAKKRLTMFTFFDPPISNVSVLASIEFGYEMASMTRQEGDLSGSAIPFHHLLLLSGDCGVITLVLVVESGGSYGV